MSQKYYVVKRGRQIGIFTSWPAAQKQVDHYSGAVFKSFKRRSAAYDYLIGQKQSSGPASLRLVTVYTDGGCRNHGNHRHQHVKSTDPAAWAYLIVNHGQKYTGTGFERGATNNRMELMALYQVLLALKRRGLNRRPVLVVADSRYVINSIVKGWLNAWRRRGWRLASGRPVKNARLWRRAFSLMCRFNRLRFKWTKGHANDSGNNFVDHLLNRTMDRMQGTRQISRPSRNRVRRPFTASSGATSPMIRASVRNLKRNLARSGFSLK